jgi:uncharacterized protein YcfL
VRHKALLFLCSLTLVGCESKATKVQRLQQQYNAEYPAYARNCVDVETDRSSRMLTGEMLTPEEIATLTARKKERDARCEPQADHLANLQKQILEAQQ